MTNDRRRKIKVNNRQCLKCADDPAEQRCVRRPESDGQMIPCELTSETKV